MYGWLVSKMIRRSVERMNAGDIGPTLANYSKDAVLVFPGDHSWGGVYDGRARIEEFLRRCVDSGIYFDIEDIVVSGWPWNTRVCVRLSDGARDSRGGSSTPNRAVLFVKSRWGEDLLPGRLRGHAGGGRLRPPPPGSGCVDLRALVIHDAVALLR